MRNVKAWREEFTERFIGGLTQKRTILRENRHNFPSDDSILEV